MSESLQATSFCLLSTHAFETKIISDDDMEAFGWAGGWVYLLLSWNLCEVEVIVGDRIRALVRVKSLRHMWKCSLKGLEVDDLSWGGP